MPATREDYVRGAKFSIAAIPFMTLALWGLSKFTSDPVPFRWALGIAVFLALVMIVGMSKFGPFAESDRDRRINR
jgi:hypothetical protein